MQPEIEQVAQRFLPLHPFQEQDVLAQWRVDRQQPTGLRQRTDVIISRHGSLPLDCIEICSTCRQIERLWQAER